MLTITLRTGLSTQRAVWPGAIWGRNMLLTRFGPGQVQCLPEDGARLSLLRFGGQDLLTTAPAAFRPPTADYGQYETRPVYGYDDCLPSVAACRFPGMDWVVPDHGELCWLKWEVAMEQGALLCQVRSEQLPLHFTRLMRFSAASLNWFFEAHNRGNRPLPLQHVMHPLMPLEQIAYLKLPKASSVFDEASGRTIDLEDVESHLLRQPRGTARMLLLRGVDAGEMTMRFRSGLRLSVTFPRELFATVGIWWNHGGYPDEDGCRRVECAFEPIPGPSSCLEHGTYLELPPRGTLRWQVRWDIH